MLYLTIYPSITYSSRDLIIESLQKLILVKKNQDLLSFEPRTSASTTNFFNHQTTTPLGWRYPKLQIFWKKCPLGDMLVGVIQCWGEWVSVSLGECFQFWL